MKNGDEVDIDCGGMLCPPCFNGGIPVVQRAFTHFQIADLSVFTEATSFEIAVDTAGENMIVAAGEKTVYAVKTDGSSVLELFDYDDFRTGCPCRVPFVDISPDGSRVLWTDGVGEIWVSMFDGTGKGMIADTIPNANDGFADLDYFSNMTPRFTADGEKIVFSLDGGGKDNIGLFEVDFSGGVPLQLVSATDIGGEDPFLYGVGNFLGLTISEENELLFASPAQTGLGQIQVYLVDKGGSLQSIYPDGPPQSCTKCLAISRDGKYILINDTEIEPGTAIILDQETDEMRFIDPPEWSDALQTIFTLHTNDDASLVLINNYSAGSSQTDILVNESGYIIYPLHQGETSNKFQGARSMLMLPNGKKIFYTVENSLWVTELNPEEVDEDFPRMASFSVSPNFAGYDPRSTSAFAVTAVPGTDPIVEAFFVEFDERALPYNRLTSAEFNGLFDDGITAGDQAADNVFTNSEVYPRFIRDIAFPDTVTVRFHLWSEGRITSYDIYPFFVLEEGQATSTIDLRSSEVFRLWPSPARDQLFFEAKDDIPKGLEMRIVNTLGQSVKSLNREYLQAGAIWQIPIAELPKGIYHFLLRTNGKQYSQAFQKL